MGSTDPLHDDAVVERVRLLREAAWSTCPRDHCAAPNSDRETPRQVDRFECARGWAASTGSDDGCALVEVVGAVDIGSRAELAGVLRAAVDGGTSAVIVDLSAVTLLSAAGIGCLQNALNLLTARGGRLHLVCPVTSPAARILRILELHGDWAVHPDVPAAVAMLEGRSRR